MYLFNVLIIYFVNVYVIIGKIVFDFRVFLIIFVGKMFVLMYRMNGIDKYFIIIDLCMLIFV